MSEGPRGFIRECIAPLAFGEAGDDRVFKASAGLLALPNSFPPLDMAPYPVRQTCGLNHLTGLKEPILTLGSGPKPKHITKPR